MTVVLRKPETPSQRVTSLQADILRVRAEQRAAQHQLEDAVTQEVRAMALLDSARAIQAKCRRVIGEHAETISSLQDEIAALLPKQRKG